MQSRDGALTVSSLWRGRRISLAIAGGIISLACALHADASVAPQAVSSSPAPTGVSMPDGTSPQDWRVEVNVPERQLRVYSRNVSAHNSDDWRIWEIFPVAVGTRRHPTPIVETTLEPGIVRPDWAAPNREWAGEHAGKLVPFMASGNPFRTRNEQGAWEGYFLPLGRTGIGLHSTNQRSSIGKTASHGCIRMHLSDVRRLYRTIPSGSPVVTVYNLYSCSRVGDSIVIKSFPDIYRRLSTADRFDQLQAALTAVQWSAEALPTEAVAELIERPGLDLSLVISDIHADDPTPAATSQAAPHADFSRPLLSALNQVHQDASRR